MNGGGDTGELFVSVTWNVSLLLTIDAVEISTNEISFPLSGSLTFLPSSSTYVTGKAVERACEKLKGRILNKAAQMMEIDSADNLEFDGKKVSDPVT